MTLTHEAIKEIVSESPIYRKYGAEDDIEIILAKVKTYIDPFCDLNHDCTQKVGEVYEGQ